jgi:hypothetical protein
MHVSSVDGAERVVRLGPESHLLYVNANDIRADRGSNR